ncbi:MAG: Hsp20/alpha crystallin family protein [Planctomycetota bacterium]|nr:MAG: Hsp20/alpha crystallin family protein [Planctomycetota bacterium]RKY12144.1 MAG: Hsp20/alpha crystallin family protein [Planctomycetota bacterium]
MTITDLVPWKRKKNGLAIQNEYDNAIGSFYREINGLMDRFFRGFDIAPWSPNELASGGFMPHVDVKEDEKKIQVTAELPGMDEKDIEVTLKDDFLVVQGEKREETEDKGKDYYHSECRYGSFHRAIPLSAEVDESKVEAKFKKGVLNITLPKTAEAQQRRKKVEIKAE